MINMILAIGNASGNIIEKIRKQGELADTQCVFVDSDEEDLKKREVEGVKIVHLDSCSDFFPADVFKDVTKLIIVAGLGGKTGTKLVELAAIAAKEAGVDSVKVVATLPFIFEGENHKKLATSAAQRLAEIGSVHVTVFNNEDLLVKYPELNFFKVFDAADKEIMHIIEKN